MALSGEGISVGDAVLHFLADTTNLDAAYDSVATGAATKLGAANEVLDKTAGKWVLTGSTAAQAGRDAVKAGDDIVGAADAASAGMYGAREAVQTVEEAIGVRLPRGVTRFVAELPGIATAMEAAFDASIIYFLISAVVQLVEHFEKLIDEPGKIAHEWVKFDETFKTTSDHILRQIDQQEEKVIEYTKGPITALDYAIKHLETTAFETFKAISSEVDDAGAAMKEQGSFFNVFGDAGKDLKKFRDNLFEVMTDAQNLATNDPLAAYLAGLTAIAKKEEEIQVLIKHRTAASGADASAAISGLQAELKALQKINLTLQEGINLDLTTTRAKGAQDTHAHTEEAAKAAKRLQEEQTKAARVASELATEYEKLDKTEVDLIATGNKIQSKEQEEQMKAASKAALDYVHSLMALGKAEQSLRNFQNQEVFAAQEAAIKKLAHDHVITEEQKAERLRALYKREEDDAVRAINSQLTAEESAIAKARQQLASLEISGDQNSLNEAKAYLNNLLAAYHLTYQELLKAKEDFNKQSEKLDDTSHAKSESSWKKLFKEMTGGSETTGEAVKNMGNMVAQGLGAAAVAATTGADSFGGAMEKMLQSALSSLEGMAIAKVITELAEAASDLAKPGMEAHSVLHFKAAAEWGLAAGAAAIGSAALSGGGGSSSGSSSSSRYPVSAASDSGSVGNVARNPTNTVNVQHFAEGGLITRRTLAMIGDSPSGGNAREAVMPLDHPESLAAIREALQTTSDPQGRSWADAY